MRTALYARVSTSDQNNEIQLLELKRYALARGWMIPFVFQDTASGASGDRPGLQALLTAARRRFFDVVLVWKLDRFGRSSIDLATNLKELDSLGIRFIAISQGIDTDQSNPVSRFLIQILSACAELEREMIAERVRAGIEQAKRKGIRLGAPKKIFDRAAVPKLRREGYPIRAIALLLKISTATVRRELEKHATRDIIPPADPAAGPLKTEAAPGA